MPDDVITPNSNPGGSSTGDLPQWARDKISELNDADAQKRIEIRNLKAELSAALQDVVSSSEAKTNAEAGSAAAIAELSKLKIALGAGVPGAQAVSIAARLQGSTDDELKADAEKLVADFGMNSPTFVPATDPSQGQGNSTPVSNLSPGGAFFKAALEGSSSR